MGPHTTNHHFENFLNSRTLSQPAGATSRTTISRPHHPSFWSWTSQRNATSRICQVFLITRKFKVRAWC